MTTYEAVQAIRAALDDNRVLRRLDELAAISAPAADGAVEMDGVTRLAYSPQMRQALDVVREWMREAGLEVYESPIGTLFGVLPGQQPDLPMIVSGSHLDTVVQGGKFDGVLGVVAAIEVLAAIGATATAERSLAVVVFAAEESARFPGLSLFASRVLCAQPITDEMLLRCDAAGITLAQALCSFAEGVPTALNEQEALAQTRRMIAESAYPPENIGVFLELHVEQSTMLEEARCAIGIVDRAVSTTRLHLRFGGEQGHSGTVLMERRHDALAAAAEAVLLVENICRADSPTVVGTVGRITAHPGAINTIPGQADMLVDLRSTTSEARQKVLDAIYRGLDELAERRGVCWQSEVLSDQMPVFFSRAINHRLDAVCQQQGQMVRYVPSRATHDAVRMALAGCRTAMLFVPSIGGISHAPTEATNASDIAAGVHVLGQTLYELAQFPIEDEESEHDTHEL